MVLALLVFLAVLFVVADRVVLKLAEDRAATALQQSQDLPSTPSVTFSGFPFLTQLAEGRFSEVTVRASGIDVGRNASLHLATVVVHLDSVTARDSYHTFHAESATADATIDYVDFSRTLGIPVSYAGGDRVRTAGTVTISGEQISGSVSAAVRASAERLWFVRRRVTAPGQTIPPALRQQIAALLGQSISLRGLPFDVRVDGVDATPNGLVLHLSGRNLTYSRS